MTATTTTTTTDGSAPRRTNRNAAMTNPLNRRPLIAVAAAVLVTGSCAAGATDTIDATIGGDAAGGIAAEVASFDLVVDRPGRFMVGIFGGDRQRLVAYGTVDLSFRYLGTAEDPPEVERKDMSARASFLPIAGQPTDVDHEHPQFVPGSEIIGVYAAPSVSFDTAGYWETSIAATVDGETLRTTSAFEVLAESSIPAPGDPAPRTEQPLARDPAVPAKAIDSRAEADGGVPDPGLHDQTVADAIAAGQPVMIVISTPTYCQSRFCGPITDSVQDLAARFGDQMAFIHLEIWRDFEAGEVNPAAAEWIMPAGTDNGREPWVFTVGRDGRIVDRFDNVASDADLQEAVERLLER